MKYEKATAKIYDLGKEEILTCSTDTSYGGNKKVVGWWSWWNWFGWWG